MTVDKGELDLECEWMDVDAIVDSGHLTRFAPASMLEGIRYGPPRHRGEGQSIMEWMEESSAIWERLIWRELQRMDSQ